MTAIDPPPYPGTEVYSYVDLEAGPRIGETCRRKSQTRIVMVFSRPEISPNHHRCSWGSCHRVAPNKRLESLAFVQKNLIVYCVHHHNYWMHYSCRHDPQDAQALRSLYVFTSCPLLPESAWLIGSIGDHVPPHNSTFQANGTMHIALPRCHSRRSK